MARILRVLDLWTTLVPLALTAAALNACGESDASGGPQDGGASPDGSVAGNGGRAGGGGSGAEAGAGGSSAAAGSGGSSGGGADAGRCSTLGDGPLTFNWSARPGDDYVAAVATTRGGQVYALHIDDNQEAHVTRLAADGAIQWKRSLFGMQPADAGPGSVSPAGLATDALGRVVVVGSFERTASFAGELRTAAYAGNRTPAALFAMRLNEDGSTSYLKTIDGVDLSAVGVAIDSSHRVWIAGNVTVPEFNANRTVNLGGSDLTARWDDGFLLELDADGSHLFSRTVGSRMRDHIVGIAIGPQGGPVIAGLMREASDLRMNDAGTGSGMYVASFDSSGALAWSNFPESRSYDGGFPFGHRITAIAASPTQVVVVGHYGTALNFGAGTLPSTENGTPSPFVVRLGASGQELEAKSFGPDPSDSTDPAADFAGVAINATGNVVIAGSLRRSTDFGLGLVPKSASADHPLFLRFDSDLNIVTSRAIGGCEFAGGSMTSAALDAAGNFIAGGSLGGNADPSRDFGGPEPRESVVFSIAP